MFEFILSGPNLPFVTALAIMLGIALMEGVGTVLGMGISSWVDNLLPDIDLDMDLPEDAPPMALSRILGWLHFGKVPALILLVVFLTAFGLIGLGLQALAKNTFGLLMPGWLASVAAFAVSLPAVRVLGGGLGKVLPKDETSAVSDRTFIGRVATITLGKARRGFPAEAVLTDPYGQDHFFMVEPDLDGEEFTQGDQVLLVRKEGNQFLAIRNPNEMLSD